ncbi:hypothetical protein [Agrobacterium tumefaciens]|uniref:hypothetical protein n=1 Tax=Agrobacterium tumefaciens TaxID=358 RepID=UPI00157493C1|nr:hypothetical protein [Agrobacterium tumefaciens]
MSEMACEYWGFWEERGCVKMDPKTETPIPGPDGQPVPRRFPIDLKIGDRLGSMYGGVEFMDSPYNKVSNENVIISLLHHAERIAPFGHFLVAPAFKVFWLDGKGSTSHDDTAEIFEMENRGLFHRTRVTLFSAGRDDEDTRERFWKALISTVASEKKYLEEVYDNGIIRWSDIDLAIRGCYRFVRQVLDKKSSRLEIAVKRGEIRREHIPRLMAEYSKGPWAAFTYLWSVYADLACETITCEKPFASPHDDAEDHLWFFYRVFFGVEGDKIENLHIGSYYDLDQMQMLRANFLAPVHAPKIQIKPMAVRPMRATG